MKVLRFATYLLALVTSAAVLDRPVLAQDKPSSARYVIELLSNDPPNDWARIARQLIERDMVNIRVEPIISPTRGPCDTVLERLGFRSTEVKLGCSIGIEQLIADLTAGNLGRVNVPPGHVGFPDLPVNSTGVVKVFDKRLTNEVRECMRIKLPWGVLANCSSVPGPGGQVVITGYEIFAEVPDTEQSDQFMRSLRRFNEVIQRNDVEVFRLDEAVSYGGANSHDPAKWLEECALRKPGYATLLGLPKTPSCQCGDRCTDIVLFDNAPAPHPAIAHKLGLDVAGQTQTTQCLRLPDNAYQAEKHHASLLAGILVSRDDPSTFTGITPWAELVWKDTITGLPFVAIETPRKTAEAIRHLSEIGEMSIVLFANEWRYVREEEVQQLQSDESFRKSNPQYVPDIVTGRNLWVVAAGNRDEGGINISKHYPGSPMNIGDQNNVLVVASCKNCNSRNATLEKYSNFSDTGMVHIAAYGGAFPAPASGTEYAVRGGTSQAAALVAGLAAALQCQWPNSYFLPTDVKIRLQSAVYPPIEAALQDGVATGVIDARKALLDPARHQVAAHGNREREASRLDWCVDKLRPESVLVGGADAPGGPVSPRALRHFVGFDTDDGERASFLFHISEDSMERSAGTVQRTGPGVFPDDPRLVRVTYADGAEPATEVLRASDIDFILSPPMRVHSADIQQAPAACD